MFMTCFKGPILHLLPIHLFLPHFLSTLLPFLIYNSTSDASLPHSSPSLPPPVFSYLLLFPAHYFTFNSCLTFILCFPSSVPVSPTTTQYVLPLIAHLIISSISLFHLLSLISLHIYIFAPTLAFPLSSIFTHRSSSFVFLKAVFLNLTLQTFLLLCLFLCFHHWHLAITASLFFLFFLLSVISFLLKFAIFSPSLHVFFCPPFLPLSLISLSSWFSFSICHFSSFQM